MRLTSKGQVTIPKLLRTRYGIALNSEVTFEPTQGGILIKPAAEPRLKRLAAALRRARGSADSGLSTDEIMRMTRGED